MVTLQAIELYSIQRDLATRERTFFQCAKVPEERHTLDQTAFTAAANNGCNTNLNTTSGGDPAIGYTPVNPGAKYVIAGPGARTTVGRNSFRSPGFYTWNFSLARNFHFTESKYFQIQAQAFNVLNHANYALSNGNVFSNSGITTALATQGYVLPTDSSFLHPKQFGGGIRTLTLAAHFFF